MVEFGIAGSLILLVLMAIMEFGNALYAYNVVTNAARLGARYAIVRGSMCTFADCPATSSGVQTYVRSVSPNINANNLTVTTTWSQGADTDCQTSPYQSAGCLVTVTVSYPFQSVGPFGNMTIASTSQMYISR